VSSAVKRVPRLLLVLIGKSSSLWFPPLGYREGETCEHTDGKEKPEATSRRCCGQCDAFRPGRGAAAPKPAHRDLERWAHEVEPPPLRRREDACPGCHVRRRARRRAVAWHAYARHQGARTGELSAHERGWVGLSARLLDQNETDTRLFHGRPGASTGARTPQDERHPPGTSRGAGFRIIPGGQGGWDQCNVLFPLATC